MNIYAVGGAIRDELLGLPVKDRDWVVVGSSPEEMLRLGYRPVGRDFPVFLHPDTHEEYALARTERKVAPGYAGFTFHTGPGVTLEQDLERRDLTINAMARDAAGHLIDPFGGTRDLEHRLFRHVSAAFREDPVRILRVARFAARFVAPFGFVVAPETSNLMRTMTTAGEVDALVPERVWQELSKGLMELHPSEMLKVLHECGARSRLWPELEPFWPKHGPRSMTALDLCAQQNPPLEVRFSVWVGTLLQGSTSPLTDFCQRMRVPAHVRDLALLVTRQWDFITGEKPATAESVLTCIEQSDGLRRAERFHLFLTVLHCLAPLYPTLPDKLSLAFEAARSISAAALARQEQDTSQIARKLREARLLAIRGEMDSPAPDMPLGH